MTEATAREGDEAMDYVMVPRSAIKWLLGEGPDADGLHFGDDPRKYDRGKYWWRIVFRNMLAAASPPPSAGGEIEEIRKRHEDGEMNKAAYPRNLVPAYICQRLEADRATLLRSHASLQSEVERLKRALTFYAAEERYDYDETCCFDPSRGWTAKTKQEGLSDEGILTDGGEIARKALETVG